VEEEGSREGKGVGGEGAPERRHEGRVRERGGGWGRGEGSRERG